MRSNHRRDLRVYLIDGVQVTHRIYERRKTWGEHSAARFETFERKLPQDPRMNRRADWRVKQRWMD
jgi:hypothetical protein